MLAGEHELTLIDGLMDDLHDGLCAVFVEGEPGIGKSTLLGAAIERARNAGITVLRAKPTEADQQIANFALLELLADTDPLLVERLPAPQRHAIRAALRWDTPSGRPLERHAVAAAVAGLLTAWLRTSSLLLVIDDLHWLDSSSAQALSYALRRLERLPLGLLAASRTHEGSHPRPLSAAIPAERVQRLDVGPLEGHTIGVLLRDRLGLNLNSRELERVVHATTGNPLLSLEVGRAVQSDGMPDTSEPLPVPKDVRVLVRRRIDALPLATQQQLYLASAHSAAAVPAPAADVLAPAVQADLIHLGPDGEIIFQHPLYRSAIYTSMPAHQRRRLHADLAEQTNDLEERAQHLALAEPEQSESVAQALSQASAAAASRGALSIAADLATRAWKATPTDDGQAFASRGVAAARLSISAGREQEAADIARAAVPYADGLTRGHALTMAGQATIWTGRVGDAFELFDQALPYLDQDPATAAFVHMGLAFGRFQTHHPMPLVIAHAEAALAVAQQAGAPSPLAEAQATLAMVRWLSGQGIDHVLLDAARANDLGLNLAPIQLRAPIIAATIEGYSDQVAQALRVFEAAGREALVAGRLSDLQYVCLHGLVLAGLAGQRHLLEFFSHTAWGAMPDLPVAEISFNHVGGVVVHEVIHLVYDGRVDEGRITGAKIRASLDAADNATGHEHLFLVSALADLELAFGNADGALAWVEPLVAVVEASMNHLEPAMFHLIPSAVEALAGSGQTTRARAVAESFHERSVLFDRKWVGAACLRALGLVDAVEGDLERAHERVSQSITELADMDYRIDLGRSWLALGLIERRRRRRAAARAALQHAEAVFAEAQCGLWLQRARSELGRTWAARRSPTLTDAERQVAAMAAQGMSNPDIAATLFISRRTVEATLSKVYRKLGVRGRIDLARTMADTSDETPGD